MTEGQRAEPSLSQKILQIEAAMHRAGLPHAFGGAIALAYYATPRATIDIDMNVFVDASRAREVLAALEGLGADPPSPAEHVRLERDGQTRVRWGRSPVDLFFSYDAYHDACMARCRIVPFGESESGQSERIRILSAEDLVIFKAIFDRPKDWRDIAEVLFAMAEELDASWIRLWLERIVGLEDERYRRFEETHAELSEQLF